jgi:hypothetical protein
MVCPFKGWGDPNCNPLFHTKHLYGGKKKKKVLENKWCQGQDKYSRKGLCNLSKTKYLTMNAKQNLILKGGAL